MLVLIGLFSFLVLRTLYKWKLGPSEFSLSGGEEFPSVPLVLYGLPLALFTWSYVDHYRMEKRYAEVASHIAGRPAIVQCETFLQSFTPKFLWAEGYVEHQGAANTMFLRRYVCTNLGKFIRSPEPENPFHSFAMQVFVHEAVHIQGEFDEAKTECFAMQRSAEAARRFGVDDDNARAVARAYWNFQYLQGRAQSGDGYFSPDCRPGGAMDLRLPDAPWA